MKKKIVFLLLIILFKIPVYSKGFTADWVNILRLNNGKYRVIIKYTNLEIGEYREAIVDFLSKKEAIEAFQKLANGATFYWGDSKSLFFPKDPEKPISY